MRQGFYIDVGTGSRYFTHLSWN